MIEATEVFSYISPKLCNCLLKIANKALDKQFRTFGILDIFPYSKPGKLDWVFEKLEDAGYIERVYSSAATQQWQFTYHYLKCLVYDSLDVKFKL